MELGISNQDAAAIGLNATVKEKIGELVNKHLGLASVVFVTIEEDPRCIRLETVNGVILVNTALSERID